MNKEEDTKTMLLKKFNTIYREMLPYVVVGSSISMCILQFINTGCTLDPRIKSLIVSTNATTIGDFEIENSLNSVSRGIVVVNGFFALVMGVYGQIVKKELAKTKNENERLSEELETLTLQRTHIPSLRNEPITVRSDDTAYPEPIHIV